MKRESGNCDKGTPDEFKTIMFISSSDFGELQSKGVAEELDEGVGSRGTVFRSST